MWLMDLSIVTTLYQSERFVGEFHARITEAARALTSRYEVIYVVDGATDGSLATACAIAREDPRVEVVELARNYGHHDAIRAGLRRAGGERVFLIDVDLEEPPELLARFWQELDDQGADVVFGQQVARKGGVFERWSGAAFYAVVNHLSAVKLPPNLLTVRLMRRRYCQALVQYGEREYCFGPVAVDAGFRQVAAPVHKASREGTTYTLARKLALATRIVTSFSDRPLSILAGVGLTILGLSGISLLWIMLTRFVLGRPVPGYTSLMASVWFLGGLTVFAVGVAGLYVGRVYREVKQRPTALIREIHRHGASEPAKLPPRSRPAAAEAVADAVDAVGQNCEVGP
jgi:putative glycosyltransferase